MAIVIETTLGDMTVDLFVQERPKACLNFLKLCKLKYYNFNLFHNVEHGFIAQTGDPTGAGDGGESVWGVVEGPHRRYFEGESLPKIRHSEPGLLSMVSLGKNMIGSQFFFTLGSELISLDGIHCVIGEVAEGHEVLRKLNEAIVDDRFRPYQDIRITHTVILEDPFDDPRGFQIPSRSPSPTPERLKNGRIGADEDIDDTEGKSMKEIQEMLQEREAKARATILEIVGDLPDADIAPPENVLFVCKLNPVTTDDDLEIIFSRFGKVKGCEVIRDKVSGDSLQYAFVEFEDKKACENAYFKMDNVLIDDRRIHVDFSQSVAKVKWRGRGRGVIYENSNSNGRLDFNNLRSSDNTNFYRNNRQRSRSPVYERNQEKSYEGKRKAEGRSFYEEKRRQDNRRTHEDNRRHEKDRTYENKNRNYEDKRRNYDDKRRDYDNTERYGKVNDKGRAKHVDDKTRRYDDRGRVDEGRRRHFDEMEGKRKHHDRYEEDRHSSRNRPSQSEHESRRTIKERSPHQIPGFDEKKQKSREDIKREKKRKKRLDSSSSSSDRDIKKKKKSKKNKKHKKKKKKESSTSSSSSNSD